MSYKTHLLVMGLGFVALLALGKFIGASIVLVLFFCMFMMAPMMLGVDHGGDKDSKGGGHGH